jgi:hypothetical protein
LIAYVDANFHVRGVETVYLIQKDSTETIEEVKKPLIDPGKKEQATFYFLKENAVEEINTIRYPNLIEKFLLNSIVNNNGINLESLKNQILKVEKSLNVDLSYDKIEEILSSYEKQNLISKESLDIEIV